MVRFLIITAAIYFAATTCCGFVLMEPSSFESILAQRLWLGFRHLYRRRACPLWDSPTSCIQQKPIFHHVALKTRNITRSILFYDLFNFQVSCRFRSGPARAAWLENQAQHARIELIEVPSYLLNEGDSGKVRRALDLMVHTSVLGYNHFALDVTNSIVAKNFSTLADWMHDLNQTSLDLFGKTLRTALLPQQQTIGRAVYEIAFVYDPDGCLVECLHQQATLSQEVDSGWEPWSGFAIDEK